MDYDVFEMVIGLEVHVELKTNSKIFCSCSTAFGAEANTQCCPVCLGLPGALPALNRQAVMLAVKAGLALNCSISKIVKMDRKNYFYPDLPKAYQISQYDIPLCEKGYVEIEASGKKKQIGITRIHIEEDAGKLIHDPNIGTLIDFNRCGVPLIEIVSEPDIRSAEEVVAYVKALRSILLYTDVSDVKMQEGSLRCDVNLSVRRRGDHHLGNRCEIKNLNSYRFISEAIEFEFRRQVNLILRGEEVAVETRRYDQNDRKTYSMRRKEDAKDYRFFPEPDLPPFRIDDYIIEKIKSEIPMLPSECKKQLMELYDLTSYDADIITADPNRCKYFISAVKHTKYPKIMANMIISELAEKSTYPDKMKLAQICDLTGDEIINSNTSKKILSYILSGDVRMPAEIVKHENLAQISSIEELLPLIKASIENNPKSVQDYRNGKKAALKAIIGAVMRTTSGRANPEKVNEILIEIL